MLSQRLPDWHDLRAEVRATLAHNPDHRLRLPRDHFKAVELPGRIIPDPNASGYVQSTLAGRLLPPPNGFPPLGTRVEKGQVLAYVTPPIQAIDVSDMRQKEGELLQQICDRRTPRRAL